MTFDKIDYVCWSSRVRFRCRCPNSEICARIDAHCHSFHTVVIYAGWRIMSCSICLFTSHLIIHHRSIMLGNGPKIEGCQNAGETVAEKQILSLLLLLSRSFSLSQSKQRNGTVAILWPHMVECWIIAVDNTKMDCPKITILCFWNEGLVRFGWYDKANWMLAYARSCSPRSLSLSFHWTPVPAHSNRLIQSIYI